MTINSFTLNTGATIPAIGFGSYGSTGQETYDAVLAALKAGYRSIDGACHYKNEKEVGKAIKDSGVPRDQLFITTKMWVTQAYDPATALDESLRALGLDYVDLYLVHWPAAFKEDEMGIHGWGEAIDKELDHVGIWHKFQDLPKSKARALGVCNYTSKKLEDVLSHPQTKVTPAVNQVELHPQLPQLKLVEYARSKGILLEAYSPLAQGEVHNPIIKGIAEKRGADAGQVTLSWNVARGVVVLPRSINPSRIASNLKLVELDKEEIAEINTLAKEHKRLVVPDALPGVFDDEVDSKA